MNKSELNEILASGNFENLIGKVENQWFECKKAPYFIDNPKQKQELAKDIVGMANAEGGVILLGVKTEKSELHYGDEVVKINYFNQNFLNPNDYLNIVNTWIYPVLVNIEIAWLQSAQNNNIGIFVIKIPSQPVSIKPFLLTRTYDENQKLTEITFGYCERKKDNIDSISIGRIHSLIKDGMRFEEIYQRIDTIESSLFKIVENGISNNNQALNDKKNSVNESTNDLLVISKLIDKPYLTLSVCPNNQVSVKGIFEGRDGDVAKLIDHPPQLRYSGFDLDIGQYSKIIEGKKRQSLANGDKGLELWKNGVLVFAANAGPDFLAWGNYDKHQLLRLNDYAITEVCYLFALLLQKLLPFYSPYPEIFSVRIQLKNLSNNDKPCVILGSIGHSMLNAKAAPGTEAEFNFDFNTEAFSAEIFSFHLVSSIYEWFGVEHNRIPFTSKKDEIFQVDPEKIMSQR